MKALGYSNQYSSNNDVGIGMTKDFNWHGFIYSI
jgi:hypothetical protein